MVQPGTGQDVQILRQHFTPPAYEASVDTVTACKNLPLGIYSQPQDISSGVSTSPAPGTISSSQSSYGILDDSVAVPLSLEIPTAAASDPAMDFYPTEAEERDSGSNHDSSIPTDMPDYHKTENLPLFDSWHDFSILGLNPSVPSINDPFLEAFSAPMLSPGRELDFPFLADQFLEFGDYLPKPTLPTPAAVATQEQLVSNCTEEIFYQQPDLFEQSESDFSPISNVVPSSPPSGKGTRILTLDGGGVRGVAELELLESLLNHCKSLGMDDSGSETLTWEAARATSAAPPFFRSKLKPDMLNDLAEDFMDSLMDFCGSMILTSNATLPVAVSPMGSIDPFLLGSRMCLTAAVARVFIRNGASKNSWKTLLQFFIRGVDELSLKLRDCDLEEIYQTLVATLERLQMRHMVLYTSIDSIVRTLLDMDFFLDKPDRNAVLECLVMNFVDWIGVLQKPIVVPEGSDSDIARKAGGLIFWRQICPVITDASHIKDWSPKLFC